MSIFNCDNLVCGYSQPLFTPLNLSLDAGQSVAIMGRSGVGKTTLITTILGMHKPLAGTVSVTGINVHKLKFNQLARLRSTTIGTVFQHGELMSGYSAVENVALPRLLWEPKDAKVMREATELLQTLDVNPQTLSENLSGGERGRVALARALINNPRLILADEPTGALDTELRQEVISLLFDAIRARGSALLLVTHDPAVAAYADQTVKLQAPN